MSQKSTLIATEEVQTANKLTESIIESDCHVVGIADTQEKIRKWMQDKEIDFLFLDLSIGDALSLLKLTQELRKKYDVKTVDLLDDPLITDYDQVKKFGVSGILRKPINEVKFMDKLMNNTRNDDEILHVQF